jgi:hypothetical protein
MEVAFIHSGQVMLGVDPLRGWEQWRDGFLFGGWGICVSLISFLLYLSWVPLVVEFLSLSYLKGVLRAVWYLIPLDACWSLWLSQKRSVFQIVFEFS